MFQAPFSSASTKEVHKIENLFSAFSDADQGYEPNGKSVSGFVSFFQCSLINQLIGEQRNRRSSRCHLWNPK